MSLARRLFAALAAALVAASATAQDVPAVRPPDAAAAKSTAELARYIDRLEAVEAAKRLQYVYGYDQDLMRPDLIAGLFADDATVDYAGGKYVGRASILRLFQTRFAMAGMAGKSGPQSGVVNDHYQMQGVIDAAEDGQSVQARFRDQVFQGKAGEELSTASGLYEVRYVKVGGDWKIAAMAYCEEWRTPYGVALNFSPLPVYPAKAPTLYPDDPTGPDRVSNYACHPWPYGGITPPMHYPHPVTGDYIHKP